MPSLELVSKNRCFRGEVHKYTHFSTSTQCKMTFNIFLPDTALSQKEKAPVLYFLSGLTCTEDNMITKAGALPYLSEEGIALVTPDTSPRGVDVGGEDSDWELGASASFYVDATQEPWKANYNMYSYVQNELQQLINATFFVDSSRVSIFGHSMGGHGALVLSVRNPGHYKSVSAFAPICHPTHSNWGRKQFTAYLGEDAKEWAKYDATELVKLYEGPTLPILIDQGDADRFYSSKQLLTSHFVVAVEANDCPIKLESNMRPGYDHSYWFVQTFIKDHVAFHAKHLRSE
ncbi:s-formylglutathione hydrolase-like protein [Coemansia spiralis]|nr:s-formylglutathione hydrolase-like protein [Coemansia spiralis]